MPGHYGKKPAAKTAAKLKTKNPKMPKKVASAIAKNMSKRKK